jgi:multidrug efflux pump subunit AcrA (membrane-fusion protein)
MNEKFRDSKIVREGVKIAGLTALFVVMMLWLSGAFVKKIHPGPPIAKPPPPSVISFKVEKRSFPLLLEQVGTLRTKTEARVSSRIMSQVEKILVKEGDTVEGSEKKKESATVLASLDNRDIMAKLRQAKSQLRAVERAMESARAKQQAAKSQVESAEARRMLAVANYQRYENLYQSQAATGQQVEEFRAKKEIAEAQLKAAKQEVEAAESEIKRLEAQKEQAEAARAEAEVVLSYTIIKAPFSGRITRKMVDVGDMVRPDQPLFILETPGHPEIHALISESLLPRLKVGQSLQVHIDALDETLEGTVREIIPRADPATRTVLVKASLPPLKELISGMFCRIRIPYGDYEALVIPKEAVREVGQLHLVDVLDTEGQLQKRFVTLGRRHNGLVEILSGLKKGEQVRIP